MSSRGTAPPRCRTLPNDKVVLFEDEDYESDRSILLNPFKSSTAERNYMWTAPSGAEEKRSSGGPNGSEGLPFITRDSKSNSLLNQDRFKDIASGSTEAKCYTSASTSPSLAMHQINATKRIELRKERPIIQPKTPLRGKKWELPVAIGESEFVAIPDTGSEENAITADAAARLGIQISKAQEECVSFQLANGSIINSIGRAVAHCRFAMGDKSDFDISFNVFQTLAVPMVIGKKFLEVTETLTRNFHRTRLVNIPSSLRRLCVLHLNRPQQRLRCYLNVDLVYANADTGAEMNLISPRFVQQRGLRTEKLPDRDQDVVLADGSHARLSGLVRARFDTFDSRKTGLARAQEHHKNFYVLDGLTTDVLLGAELLHDIQAFTVHPASFVDFKKMGIHSDLNLVTWWRKNKKKAAAANTAGDPAAELEIAFQHDLDDDDAREQNRRETADSRIKRLPARKQEVEMAEEERRRQEFGKKRERRIQDHNAAMAVLAQQQNGAGRRGANAT